MGSLTDRLGVDTIDRVERTVGRPADPRTETALWVAAIGSFVIGDVVTTMVGLQAGAIEANVLPAYLLSQADTFVEMSAIKISWKVAVLWLFLGMYDRFPRPHRVGIPIGLVLLGTVAVAWNLAVIAALVG